MSHERRQSDRYAVQRPALVRYRGNAHEAVCTNVNLEGAFLRCPAVAALGEVVEVAIAPRRASRADIEIQAHVVYVSSAGAEDRRGLGVRWIAPEDSGPLAALVRWAANLSAQGLLDTGTRMPNTQLEPPQAEPGSGAQGGQD
ncbi:MAG: PilZ domain-containing protein [Deltaproteobacteria bacterium]|nr:PilZ domain-containing protein [Deltaproteobacteria bacterium]